MAAKTTKKKTSSKAGRKKTKSVHHVNEGMYHEITILTVLAICVLLILSNFGAGGIVGEAVSSILFGIFGLTAYVIPIVLFCAVAFGISNKGNRHAYIKLAAGILLLIAICAFLELITNSYDATDTLLSSYHKASVRRNAGGLIGGCLIHVLCPLLGVAGTYVVLVVLALICCILITERSFLGAVKKGGSKAYEDAKRRREMSARKRQEQENEQGETGKRRRKVSGVSFATTLVGKSPEVKELYADDGADSKTAEKDTEHNIDENPSPSGEKTFMINRAVQELSDEEPLVNYEETETEKDTSSTEEDVSLEQTMNQNLADTVEPPFPKEYKFPPMKLLAKGKNQGGDSDAYLSATAMKLEQTLQNFGVNVHVNNVSCGPSVTRYELQPEQGVKVSKIVGLADDIKLNLAVSDLRIEAPIPGKAAVGIEVPNKEASPVMLRDLLESSEFKKNKSNVAFAVGKDISGKTIVADIAKMPHVLVAGATGSGKSVCINTLIMSILYKAKPEDVKLIMVDPKVVELSVYNGIPHLLIPVVTDPKKASGALNWAVAEMMKRYELFAQFNVRDMKGFNAKLDQLIKEGSQENLPVKMPQIVIIVDELADLMMVAPGEVEGAICRLAQLARAAGIHLVLATQRPSVNVITGLIKANMPSRIAFSTTSGVDSRTIIDMNGAEKLLGKGDMLFYPSGYPKPVRVQGSFVSDQEVQKVVDFLIEENGNASYNEDIEQHVNTSADSAAVMPGMEEARDDRDAYFIEAGKFIIEKEKASIGMLQRMFKIGFNRAARIMDQLSEAGVVGGEEGTKPRKILMTMEDFEAYLNEEQE